MTREKRSPGTWRRISPAKTMEPPMLMAPFPLIFLPATRMSFGGLTSASMPSFLSAATGGPRNLR